ncbi:MAG: hypothetical protein M3373_13735, partial [Gemmatimonadota bacterium]|nr:hypothetical protein [Gemmatimonadota bacterium]
MSEVLNAYDELDRHWAVTAISPTLRRRAIQAAARHSDNPSSDPPDGADADAILSLATAYDLAAIEGADAFLKDAPGPRGDALRLQLRAGATRAFTLYRVLRLPADDGAALLCNVVRVAAVGV